MANHKIVRLNRALIFVFLSLATLLTFATYSPIFEFLRFPASISLAIHCVALALTILAVNSVYSRPSGDIGFSGSLVNILIWGFLWVHAIIGGMALYKFEAQSLWAASFLLLLPVLWKNYVLLGELSKEEDRTDPNENLAEGSKPAPKIRLIVNGIYGAVSAASIPLLLVLIVIGFVYFYYLEAAIFSDDVWSLGRTFRIATGTGKSLGTTMLALIVVMAMIYGGLALWEAFRDWHQKQLQPDIDRDLTQDELNLISDSVEGAEKCAEEISRSKWPLVIQIIWWFGFLGVMVLAAIAGFSENWIVGHAFFEERRTVGLTSFFYDDGPGISSVLSIFLYLALWGWLPFLVSRFWPALRNYAGLSSLTEGATAEDKLGKLRHRIALDVRRYNISFLERFDLYDYIEEYNRKVERWFLYSTVVLCVLTVPFWYFDRTNYELLTPDGIEYSPYSSLEIKYASYSDVVKIGLRCKKNDKDNLRLFYSLQMSDGYKFNVVEYKTSKAFSELLPHDLELWELIDYSVRSGEVQIVRGFFPDDAEKAEDAFDTEKCRGGLKEHLDDTTTERVMRLMKEAES